MLDDLRRACEYPNPSTCRAPLGARPSSLHARGARCRTISNARHWRRRSKPCSCTVERIDIEPQFLVPEGFVEPFEQRRSLGPQVLRTVRLAECVERLGHSDPSVVNVALKLAQCL